MNPANPQRASSVSPTPARKQPPKLLDQVSAKLRMLHYSKRTEEAYLDWMRRDILFHNKRHPRDMGGPEIEAILTHLAEIDSSVRRTEEPTLASLRLNLYNSSLPAQIDL